MGNVPSRAAEQLAVEATDRGWPTTSSQVEELTKRKVLPAPVVVRRGRGVTVSEYPSGTLDVLVAVRAASSSPGFRQHRRAVFLAWVRGARVRDEGLREAILQVLDETHRAASVGIRRRHRKEDPLPIPNPTDRMIVLDAVASLMVGKPPPRLVADFTVQQLQPVFDELLPASQDHGEDSARLLPAPSDLQAELGRFLSGKDPESGTEAMDLTMTGARAFVSAAPRELLDLARDVARLLVGKDDLSSADELQYLMGVMVGVLSGFSAADDFQRRRNGEGLVDRVRQQLSLSPREES